MKVQAQKGKGLRGGGGSTVGEFPAPKLKTITKKDISQNNKNSIENVPGDGVADLINNNESLSSSCSTNSTVKEDVDLKIDSKQVLDEASMKNVKIVLKRVPINTIVITPASGSSFEISYIGFEENYTPGSKGKKYSEYRVETITALSKRKGTKVKVKQTIDKDDSVVLYISRDYNSVFNVHGFRDDMHSILDVLKGQKMSTMVLDAFLTYRVKSFAATMNASSSTEAASKDSKGGVLNPSFKFKYLSVHFLPVYDQEQSLSTYTPNMKYFPAYSLENCILIAPLYVCKHYYLAIFNFTCNTVYVYDSCWSYVAMYYRFHQIKNILKALTGITITEGAKEQSWDIHFVDKCTQQIDEYNCGCFVIYFAENELKGKSYKNEIKISAGDTEKIRQEIVRQLLPSTNVGKCLLDAITI